MTQKLKEYQRICRRCSKTYRTTCKYGKICDECCKPSGRQFRGLK